MNFKVGDEVRITSRELTGLICKIILIKNESILTDIAKIHPFCIGHWFAPHELHKITKLERALK
mgnify:CR=1 FL=1